MLISQSCSFPHVPITQNYWHSPSHFLVQIHSTIYKMLLVFYHRKSTPNYIYTSSAHLHPSTQEDKSFNCTKRMLLKQQSSAINTKQKSPCASVHLQWRGMSDFPKLFSSIINLMGLLKRKQRAFEARNIYIFVHFQNKTIVIQTMLHSSACYFMPTSMTLLHNDLIVCPSSLHLCSDAIFFLQRLLCIDQTFLLRVLCFWLTCVDKMGSNNCTESHSLEKAFNDKY